MATRTTVGFFSEMLDDRLRNYNKRLSPDAIELLDEMERAYRARRAGELGVAPDELPEEDGASESVRSLDAMIPELRELVAPHQELITAFEVKQIVDFFCPGLPPIC